MIHQTTRRSTATWSMLSSSWRQQRQPQQSPLSCLCWSSRRSVDDTGHWSQIFGRQKGTGRILRSADDTDNNKSNGASWDRFADRLTFSDDTVVSVARQLQRCIYQVLYEDAELEPVTDNNEVELQAYATTLVWENTL